MQRSTSATPPADPPISMNTAAVEDDDDDDIIFVSESFARPSNTMTPSPRKGRHLVRGSSVPKKEEKKEEETGADLLASETKKGGKKRARHTSSEEDERKIDEELKVTSPSKTEKKEAGSPSKKVSPSLLRPFFVCGCADILHIS